MQNPIDPLLTLFGIATITFILVAAISTPAISVAASILVLTLGAVTGSKLHKSNQKDSPIIKYFAKLWGWRVHNCGCVYRKNTSRHSTNVPSAEWIDKEKVYERSMVGAKVRFQKKKSGMKRCTRCGKHYQIVEGYTSRSNSHKRICWPEEEPDVREKLNHRVIES